MNDLQFVWRMSKAHWRLFFTAFWVLAITPNLSTENVTLMTNYPSPSGIYTRLITTEDTVLARDRGSVSIGGPGWSGELTVKGGVRIGFTTLCDATKAGTLRWNPAPAPGALEICNGTSFGPIAGTGTMNLPTTNCTFGFAHRWSPVQCPSGTYMKALIKSTDGNWDGYGPVCCRLDNSVAITYNALASDCAAHRATYGAHNVTCPTPDP